jgi:CheY-like chemotaxis protein
MRPRVLLVEPVGDSAAALSKRLDGNTHIEFLGCAEGTEQAMDMLREVNPDLLLLDVHRWNGSALELCRQVRRFGPVPLAVLASSMTPERWRSLQAAGATELLLKHVDTAHLGRELAKLATVNQPKERSDD